MLYTLLPNPNLQAVCQEHPATDGCRIPMPDTTANADCRSPAANSKHESVNLEMKPKLKSIASILLPSTQSKTLPWSWLVTSLSASGHLSTQPVLQTNHSQTQQPPAMKFTLSLMAPTTVMRLKLLQTLQQPSLMVSLLCHVHIDL